MRLGWVVWVAVCGALGATGAAWSQQAVVENHLLTQLREEASAYENGEGVPRDGVRAATLYCKAARMGDAESQYNLAWMYANGRGVDRNDATAAFFFHAAAEQGLASAQRMLSRVGGPSNDLPDCMRVAPAAEALVAVAREVPAPAPEEVRSTGPKYIVDMVKIIAPEFKVDPQLALAFIKTESNFEVTALSPKNAQGLMQLIPETAARFNVKRPFDPAQNIRGGLAYIRWLLAYYRGDVALVAAAYNAGEGAVDRYRGVPPYVETLGYVSKILRTAGMISHPFDTSITEPSVQLPHMRDVRR
ncbi:MAG: lytic transglycosylase domain-containing protein [Rhizobacter sp.]